jgi:hypothetical protein
MSELLWQIEAIGLRLVAMRLSAAPGQTLRAVTQWIGRSESFNTLKT